MQTVSKVLLLHVFKAFCNGPYMGVSKWRSAKTLRHFGRGIPHQPCWELSEVNSPNKQLHLQVKTRCFREGRSTMAPNMIRLPTASRCFKDLGVGPTNQKNQSNGDYESRWAPDPVMKTDSWPVEMAWNKWVSLLVWRKKTFIIFIPFITGNGTHLVPTGCLAYFYDWIHIHLRKVKMLLWLEPHPLSKEKNTDKNSLRHVFKQTHHY